MLLGCAASGDGSGRTGRSDGGPGGGDGSTSGFDGSGGFDGSRPGFDAGGADGGTMFCGPDAAVDAGPPPAPGDCMAGVAVPGCECETVGETRDCRTGRTITCDAFGEFGGKWGPCLGNCFSTGTWAIDNLSPCFITYSGGQVYAVSTILSGGTAMCPDPGTMPPPARPAGSWSPTRLTVDCEGQFRLCYTLKAGNADTPSDADCVVAEVCTEGWYTTRNVTQELPPLDSWVGTDSACAAQFASSGGYGEMSVVGRTIDCEGIDDDAGGRYVFNRVRYCPLCCSDGSCSGAMCDRCMMGGSGSF
jgi:hypothetical protein